MSRNGPGTPDHSKQKLQVGRAIGLASAVGLDMAILTGGGVLVGHSIDGRLHSSPLGLLIGLFLGLATGIYTVYLLVRPIVRSLW